MNGHGRKRRSRLIRGAIVATAVIGLVIGGAPPALAGGPDRSSESAPAAPAPAGDAVADAQVRAALARDLDLTSAEVDTLVTALSDIDELAEQLRIQLGGSFAGSWFDHQIGSLVVATTDSAAVPGLVAAGVTAEVVSYSEAELRAIQQEVDELVESDPAAMADAYAWRVDVTSNEVVLTVAADQVAEFAPIADAHGDAVRVEGSPVRPGPQHHRDNWLDGGTWHELPTVNPWCSTAFNASNPTTGERYYLTAGHCGGVGLHTLHGGIDVGPYVASTFPGADEALVQITNGHWATGPWVWQWPGVIGIQGARSSPVGTPICHSGNTTQVTCGVITAKNVTVNYAGGDTVFGMGEHNACTEPGDSGGATYSPSYFAEGIHSGGSTIDGLCLEKFGLQNIAYYQEITDTLGRYQAQFGVQLLVTA